MYRSEPAALGSVAYLALVGSVFTFGVYMWLLRHVSAYLLSLTSFITPVLALSFGALVGGEPLTLPTLAGTALVLLGVGLTLKAARPLSARRARSIA